MQGGTGPVLITRVNAKTPLCEYNIIWRTGHACKNNDVITTECQFSNGEVSFDLKKLEKPKKRLSYGVTEGDYEYRIKVCSNGQPCGMFSRVALTHYDITEYYTEGSFHLFSYDFCITAFCSNVR